MMRFLLSLAFSVLRFIIKVHERLIHKPPMFKICLALRVRISTQYVRCFLSGVSPETLVHRPGNFLHSRKFLCFFPSFLGSLHFFKWPFSDPGFSLVCTRGVSLSWAQLVLKTNLEYSLSHSR